MDSCLYEMGLMIHSLFTGGSQEGKVRSGTENVAGIVSMSKALRLILDKLQIELEQLRKVSNELRKGLEKIDGIVINTPEKFAAPHIIKFLCPTCKIRSICSCT